MKTHNLVWYRRALMTLALLVFAGSTAFADVPDAPVELYAGWSGDGQGNRTLDVVWINGSKTDDIDGYYLYQSFNSGSFSRVATVEADEEDLWGGYTQLSAGDAGLYTFYVTAYNDDGESAPSYEASVELASVWIQFALGTPDFAEVEAGKEYTYTFSATASNNADVRYMALPAMDRWGNEIVAEMDAETGEFSVTLNEDGMYSFPILAHLADDTTNFATTMLTIQVGDGGWHKPEPEFCAEIRGTVKDAQGNPVVGGFVTVLSADEEVWGWFGAPVMDDGSYVVPVWEGSYRLVYEGMFGEYQFHPDTDDFEESTVFTMECGDTTVADFVVEPWNGQIDYITVSGRVTRASDNSGVPATVVFYADDEWACFSSAAMTDEEGNYEIELPLNFGPRDYTYIAMAMPYEPGLYPQYFDGVINPEEATVISESRNDVDFSLSGIPVFNNSISGVVKDEEGNPVNATVMAFAEEVKDDIYLPLFGIAETDNGAYTLQNLAPGAYILVVFPHEGELVPGYYAGAGQTVTMSWEDAVLVEMDSTTTITSADMILPGLEAEGINVVEGTVSQANGGIRGGKGDDVLGAEPLSGALVYVLDENDNIVGSAVSAKDGSFRIGKIGTGTYRLYADKIGFISYGGMVTFDKQGSRHTVDVTMDTQTTTGVNDQLPDNAGFVVWPNPAASQTSVRFTALPGTVRLTVNDMTGREMIVRDVTTVAGENTVQLDLGALSNGMYMVTLKAGNSVLTAPVTVVR